MHAARRQSSRLQGGTSATVNSSKTKKHQGKPAILRTTGSKISSRGYRPAPLFERTPPSAVTARRPPGCLASGAAVSYSAGEQARSGGRCYQRRSPTATRNVIEPGPKELVVVSMCCGALWVQRVCIYTFSPHDAKKNHSPTPHVGVDHASLSVTPLSIRARGGGRRGWRASGDGTSGRPRASGARERGRERGRCVL